MPTKQRPRLTKREKKAKTSALVKVANESEDLMKNFKQYGVYKENGLDLKIEFYNSKNIEKSDADQVFDLVKVNMQQFYEQCDWGWSDIDKTAELTHEDAKFLLAKDESGKLLGFSHFRFDVEMSYPILYCYELQIDSQIQRKGLGKHLMNLLFLIADRLKLVKVILTVFKHNPGALDFYSRCLSFRYDVTCPKECEEECYVIFSKIVDKNDIVTIPWKGGSI